MTQKYDIEKLGQLVNQFKELKVLCVGDLMLDRFVSGEVKRLSPEASVPVLHAKMVSENGGGAANTVSNLASLGAQVAVVGLVGDDANGKKLAEILSSVGADTEFVLRDDSRPTITKTRFIGPESHNLLRVDEEETHPLSPELTEVLVNNLPKVLLGCDAVILSDYGKGLLSDDVAQMVIKAAKEQGIPVLVDPKGSNPAKYRGADVMTPNRSELAALSGDDIGLKQAQASAALRLMSENDLGHVLLTKSEDGMALFCAQDATQREMASYVGNVVNVSGAGDSLISTFTLGFCLYKTGKASLEDVMALAAMGAALSVEQPNTSLVHAKALQAALPRLSIAPERQKDAMLEENRAAKIISKNQWNVAAAQIKQWQDAGLKVGFTNGCFDILHVGHVGYLAQAKARCDKLVLGLNDDASVRILKGPERPVNDEMARAGVMASLASIDMVVLFGADKAGDDNTPCALIEQIKPDIFVKGGDYTIDQLPEAKVVHSYGGEVEVLSLFEGYSTTNIIKKMRS